jgi:hypothetical protein
MGDERLEPTQKTREKTRTASRGGAESGALPARNGPKDAKLATIIDAWDGLPESIKDGILAMTRAVAGGT